MEVLRIEDFVSSKLKTTTAKERSYEDNKYTSVRFAYNGKEVPAIRIDGKFRLFRFKKEAIDTYSLAIKCENNDKQFKELCKAISKETSRIIYQVENFELLKDTKSGKAIFAKLYTRDSGKVKCRISLKSAKNVIEVDKLVDE